MRTARIARKTNETDITLTICLDGRGVSAIQSGVGFLDHMLTLLARHGRLDLELTCRGDTQVDDHHSVEDIGIALGDAVAQALGEKRGVRRYASLHLPMDEALILCAVDLSGRGGYYDALDIPAQKIGRFDTELVYEFMNAFAVHAGLTLHLRRVCGRNSHHIVEGAFKALGGALKALKPDITLSIMKSNGGDSEKVYYNENVCREVGGAFREILQVGVESVGQIDPYAEAEVIALAARSLEQLSPKYVLALSDVSFVGSLLDQMGLSAPVRGKVLGLVARKNVPGLCVLAERGELTGEQADGLRELVELYAPLKEGIGRVGRLAKSNAAWEALRQLSLTAGLLESFGLEERVRLDFSLVNSMDYYNGVIFQGFLPGLHTPVLSGGRYDNLPRKMGKQVGAIGFALSMGLLEERADGGRFDADVLLTYGPDAELAGLAAFAEALRASGRSVRCERAGGSAQLRCRTELRYRSGMTPEEVGL